MIFVPILIITLILLVITVLLFIADKLLVSYGECKITVRQDDELKEFTVDGGGYLHSELTNNGISITSSCAGKASCGYCKVQLGSGGGPILPTEEIFMNREEKLGGMRLACQVKVKEDMEIIIPDFLETVKGIVKNKSYDPKLRWKLIRTGRPDSVLEGKNATKLEPEVAKTVLMILDEYEGMNGSLIPILQRINSTYNYLPEPVLRYTAKGLNKSVSELYRIATFYHAFNLEPKGENVIKVCIGTACYVKGAEKLLDAVRRKLGLKNEDTTKDMKFSVETVSCIGCCGQSPVMSVNDDIYGYLKPDMIDGIIRKYETEAKDAKIKT